MGDFFVIDNSYTYSDFSGKIFRHTFILKSLILSEPKEPVERFNRSSFPAPDRIQHTVHVHESL